MNTKISIALIVVFLFAHHACAYEENALILYRTWSDDDGWVRYSYKTSYYWDDFRSEVKSMFNVDYRKHVDASMLSNYDILFVLTPSKDIPADERDAIVEWVKNGGKLVITQDEAGIYANEITEQFGISFEDVEKFAVNGFSNHPLTTGINLIEPQNEDNGRIISTSGDSHRLGWNANSCFIAINESAGSGKIIAIGEEVIWRDGDIDKNGNRQFLRNILFYFSESSEIPEFSPFTLVLAVAIIAGCVLRMGIK